MKSNQKQAGNKELSGNKITYSGKMYAVDFEIMCITKLKRICRGYSPQETAFLMGVEKNYILNRERLKDVRKFSVLDLARVASVLDFDLPRMVPSKYVENNVIEYSGVEIWENEKVTHEVTKKTKSGKANELVLKISENDPLPEVKFPHNQERNQLNVHKLIQTLYDIGYFSTERAPLNIYSTCSQLVSSVLSPILVLRSLEELIKDQKIKRIKEGRYFMFRNF